MMPLIEMLQNAQNGQAMGQMAKQFGLDEAQVSKAVEAVMPAFSTGLKRNAATPDAMGNFLKVLSSGQHAKYFDDAAQAFSPQAASEGNGILGHLFGSKDVSRAVAQQAEAASGVSQSIIKQMLPVIASTIMGGMFNQTNQQMQAMGGGSGNVFGDMIGQMMGGGSGNNPLGSLIGQMMGGGQSTGNGNPLGDMLGSFLDGGQQSNQSNPLGDMLGGFLGGQSGQSNPLGNIMEQMITGGDAKNPYGDMFGQMFDVGKNIQADQQKNMDSIFDQFLGGMNK